VDYKSVNTIQMKVQICQWNMVRSCHVKYKLSLSMGLFYDLQLPLWECFNIVLWTFMC